MTTLIITEKPKTAQKIAFALAPDKPILKRRGKVGYYEFERDGETFYVASAVGHIFSLKERGGKDFSSYPVFDIDWAPAFEVDRQAAYTREYYTLLESLARKADRLIVATDFDIEGEVIGYTIVTRLAGRKDAERMKFSALTKRDLEEAFVKRMSSLAWDQAIAGETRHKLDWYYGINLSRMLSAAIKAGGIRAILSTGRVQAPALKIVADREREIQAFTPKPYWEVHAELARGKRVIKALHEEERFWEKEKAVRVVDRTREAREAVVRRVEKREQKLLPPPAFDLTTLQTEAYAAFKIKPAETLSIAQELYIAGLISYPRTSSQQLPPSLGYTRLLESLKEHGAYKPLVEAILARGRPRPVQGKKTDPAHPAIYPTGQMAALEGRKRKVYDLIVRRFLAAFMPPAIRASTKIVCDVNGESFFAKGVVLVEKGWLEAYPFAVKKDEPLPVLSEGDRLDVRKVELVEKETQPPKRYTPASLVKELEKRGLGTKATRSQIIQTLYDRGYIEGESIHVTDLGMKTVQLLEEYVPLITDEQLTRSFEQAMEEIKADREKQEEVLARAREVIRRIIHAFEARKDEAGSVLAEAYKEDRQAPVLGPCPVCSREGREGELVLRKGKYGWFVGCSAYPTCTLTWNVPRAKYVAPAGNACEACGSPLLMIGEKKRELRAYCPNPSCPSRQEKLEREGMQCPKCGEGVLVKRESRFGVFLGCSRYPTCDYMERDGKEIVIRKSTTKKKGKRKRKREGEKGSGES